MPSTKIPAAVRPMTTKAAARIESSAAIRAGGQVKSGTFTSRAKSTAAKHANKAKEK